MTDNKRPIIFGEVLYDCFPDGRQVLGGAPFNVAWHCQAFGLNPLFISRVGNDVLGKEIRTAMQEWGMATNGLQLDDKHPTGKVEVSITDGEPSYDIVPNSAWDFIDVGQLPELKQNMLLYHGSLISRNNVSQSTLEWLKQKADCPVFVDINLRAPWWTLPAVKEIIQNCNWLKLNEDELGLVLPELSNLAESMAKLQSKYALEMVIVTQGEKGAVVLSSDSRLMSIEPAMKTGVMDTVGAGDAFSSIILVGHYNNWPLQTTLERAQAFASAIVGIRGATINQPSFYQPFIEEWQLTSR